MNAGPRGSAWCHVQLVASAASAELRFGPTFRRPTCNALSLESETKAAQSHAERLG
jgi:hypothetical protein